MFSPESNEAYHNSYNQPYRQPGEGSPGHHGQPPEQPGSKRVPPEPFQAQDQSAQEHVPPSQAKPIPRPIPQKRMSKAEALTFVDRCKKWLIAGSMVSFGVLSGLAAGHVVGSSTSNAAPAPVPNQNTQTAPDPARNFFQQQQPQQSQQQQNQGQGGGYGFGSGNQWQPPVSSSHAS